MNQIFGRVICLPFQMGHILPNLWRSTSADIAWNPLLNWSLGIVFRWRRCLVITTREFRFITSQAHEGWSGFTESWGRPRSREKGKSRVGSRESEVGKVAGGDDCSRP